MSKTKNNTPLEQLIEEGKTIIEGESREEVYQKAEALVAAIPAGTKWTRSIVEHNQGQFSQTYSLIK